MLRYSQIDAKKLSLKELTSKEIKAQKDKGKRTAGEGSSTKMLLPSAMVTAQALPQLSEAALAITVALAEQLNNRQSFERANTYVKIDGGSTECRVSPLEGISCAEYVMAASALRDTFEEDSTFLIKACTVLTNEGGHMTLKDLWKAIGGPASAGSSAQKMIDRLMDAPVVCLRFGLGSGQDAAWLVTPKELGVSYGRLGSLMKAIQPPSMHSASAISKERLRALKRLATSAADRRLIEMAALDQVSVRATRTLGGRWHDSIQEQEEHERLLYAALETFKAYEELAKQDTLAEVSALLGGAEICDAELQAEVEKLERLESSLEPKESTQQCVMEAGANYLTEEMGAELQEALDFDKLLDDCTAAQTNELADRLQAAALHAGVEIELDSQSLSDAGKQEELVQLFGEGWDEALRSCLDGGDTSSEAWVVPPEQYEIGADPMDHETIMDRAEDLCYAIKSELGAEGEPGEEEGQEEGTAELMLLANLTPRQLVVKLMARNCRRRMRQAHASTEVVGARRSLTGESGRAACLETTLGTWPDIGDKIEAICKDLEVGADAKRRDGSLTINSAVNRGKGGTGFTRIRLELKRRHGIELSLRALRDLCVARDRRHLVSARYKGIVNLRYRRSVKRITHENLDDHRQNAFYKLLHHLRDRCNFDNTLWFQRDDHAKVRESTREHATVTSTGEGASTLQHDFMSAESSSLYASSILISGCENGGEDRCLAVVKADKLAPSTPSQHYADFYMLQHKAFDDSELRPIFFGPDGRVKPKVQLEVDGGADESPSGRETQFLQTELLMGGPLLLEEKRRSYAGTTTRESFGSAKNKVERLNGEMTRAASGFHALPTDDVVGPLRDAATGQFDQSQLEALWREHTEQYRLLLDGKCGLNDSSLAAFHGATEASCEEAKILLKRRPVLLEWLNPKQSKKRRAELERLHAAQVEHFKKVQAMQAHVQTTDHYACFARCCLSTLCSHCKGAPRLQQWYEGGPALKPPPPPVPDPDRPGHYRDPEATLQKYAADGYCVGAAARKPPSDSALAIFEKEMGRSLKAFPDAKLDAAVKELNDVRITRAVLQKHFMRLHFIRLRAVEGHRKGAETRAANKEARSKAAAPLIAAATAQAAAAQKAAEIKAAAEAATAAETIQAAQASATAAQAEATAAQASATAAQAEVVTAQAQAAAAQAQVTAAVTTEAEAEAEVEAEAEAPAATYACCTSESNTGTWQCNVCRLWFHTACMKKMGDGANPLCEGCLRAAKEAVAEPRAKRGRQM